MGYIIEWSYTTRDKVSKAYVQDILREDLITSSESRKDAMVFDQSDAMWVKTILAKQLDMRDDDNLSIKFIADTRQPNFKRLNVKPNVSDSKAPTKAGPKTAVKLPPLVQVPSARSKGPLDVPIAAKDPFPDHGMTLPPEMVGMGRSGG